MESDQGASGISGEGRRQGESESSPKILFRNISYNIINQYALRIPIYPSSRCNIE
jgi:hypothetical protein